MNLEILFRTFDCPFQSFMHVFFLSVCFRGGGVWLSDSLLPLFVCPLALSARDAGTTGRWVEEIKHAAARSAGTWPQKMPPGSHN